MGQYHYTANFDRREYLNPHVFGDGLKLMEFGASGGGTMLGLAALLAASNGPDGRGGGDLHPWLGGPGYEGREIEQTPERAAWLMQNMVGRWAGDRIGIVGDYHEPSDAQGLVGEIGTPWEDESSLPWTDISELVLETIQLDFYVRQEHEANTGRGFAGGPAIVSGNTATL